MTHSIGIGSATVTLLEIASSRRSGEQLSEIFGGVPREDLAAAASATGDPPWAYTLALLAVGGRRILVDTGFGYHSGGPGVCTADLLAGAGVNAGDIDTVVITHAHGDHIGALISDGKPSFPSATLAIGEAEHVFWAGSAAAEHYGVERVGPVRDAMLEYRDATKLLRNGDPVCELDNASLRAYDAPGHTPGHIILLFESKGEAVWLLADTLHDPFQLVHLDWSPRFDVDPAQAVDTRRLILSRVAESGAPAHLFHFAFPGIGMITRDGDQYRFVPLAEPGE